MINLLCVSQVFRKRLILIIPATWIVDCAAALGVGVWLGQGAVSASQWAACGYFLAGRAITTLLLAPSDKERS